jgi:tetrahydromethanopterin S-methyltransferase subunit F
MTWSFIAGFFIGFLFGILVIALLIYDKDK